MASPAPPLPTVPGAPPEPLGIVRTEVNAIVGGGAESWRLFFEAIGQLAVSLVIAAFILTFTLWASRWAARLTRRAVGRLQRTGRPTPPCRASWPRWCAGSSSSSG